MRYHCIEQTEAKVLMKDVIHPLVHFSILILHIEGLPPSFFLKHQRQIGLIFYRNVQQLRIKISFLVKFSVRVTVEQVIMEFFKSFFDLFSIFFVLLDVSLRTRALPNANTFNYLIPSQMLTFYQTSPYKLSYSQILSHFLFILSFNVRQMSLKLVRNFFFLFQLVSHCFECKNKISFNLLLCFQNKILLCKQAKAVDQKEPDSLLVSYGPSSDHILCKVRQHLKVLMSTNFAFAFEKSQTCKRCIIYLKCLQIFFHVHIRSSHNKIIQTSKLHATFQELPEKLGQVLVFENLLVPIKIAFYPPLKVIVDVKGFVDIDKGSLPRLLFLFFIHKPKELKRFQWNFISFFSVFSFQVIFDIYPVVPSECFFHIAIN